MIKGIASGTGIHVVGGAYTTPYINPGAPSAGLVRFNNNNFEVYDGSSWVSMQTAYPTIELDGPTQEILAWARRKMEEEKRMLDLAARHPTVADAVAARERADEAVKIAVALCDVK